MSPWLALWLVGLQASVIDLVPGQDPVDSLQSAYVFVDHSASLDLAEIRQMSHRFEPNSSDFINPGTISGVVWVRFEVRNQSNRSGEWILSLNRTLVDPGAVYLVAADRTRTLLADNNLAYASSYAEFGTLAARFDLPPEGAATLYIKYRGGNWSGLAASISTAASLQQKITGDLLVVFALVGGVLTLILYVSVAFLLLDRQVVVLYVMAQLALLLFYLHLSGVTTVYLWPEQPHSAQWLSPVTMGIFIAAMLQFARRFFDTRSRSLHLDRLLMALLLGVITAMAMMPFAFPNRLPLYFMYALTALAWIAIAPLAIYASMVWDRDYWPIAVSWSGMLAMMVFIQLIWVGVVDTVPLNQHLYGAFVYFEAVFLALGIALRIRRMRIQRIDAEKRLNRSLAGELEATQRAVRLAEEREWALGDLAEKGRLILAAGHDTRQMISSLRHYALGLQRSAGPERAAAAGAALQQIASNLDEVLGTAISGSSSGGIGDRTIALERVTPAQILTPLKLIYGGMAAEKGIDLRIRMTSTPLVTDRVLVARIVSNLVSNALKYTDTGKVLVACRSAAGGHRFLVYDTGHGLPPEALEKLLHADTGAVQFEPGAAGHGAGLHIAKALAVRIGGVLDGRSTLGRGSVFELRLPPLDARAGGHRRLQVVVLDTGDPLAESLQKQASAMGLDIVCMTRPEEALELASREHVLILVDEHFGGALAGLKLAREMRRQAPGSSVAVMTYDRSIEARMRAVEACPLIVYKPLSAALLQAAAGRHAPAG